MTARERALNYLRIFANVGADRWRNFIPCDGTETEGSVFIGGIEVGPGSSDRWFLRDGDDVTWYRKAVAV